MRVLEILDRCRRAGIGLSLDGNREIVGRLPKAVADSDLIDMIRDRKPEILKRLRHANRDTVCEKCGSSETVEVPIHEGKSTRLDCARCGRFMRFGLWYELESAW